MQLLFAYFYDFLLKQLHKLFYLEFIKYLALEFAEPTFFNKDNEYDIDYQYEEEGDYRIAEVTATFNYTRYRPKDDRMLMDKLVDRIKIND